MKYRIALHKSEEGYSVSVPGLPGCWSQGATEDEAMKMLTINPAWIMGVQDMTGSIDVGKDADLVLWDGYPLSTYGVPAKVWIDGDLYFDRSLPGLGMPQFQEGQ